jgi:hypothetical protein
MKWRKDFLSQRLKKRRSAVSVVLELGFLQYNVVPPHPDPLPPRERGIYWVKLII